MSKIQEFFSAGGRRLFDSEKPVVDAFNDKYGRALAGASAPQHHAERANPKPNQNPRTLAGQVITNATRYSEQTRVLAGSVLSQKPSGSHVHRLAASVLGSDKDARASQSVSAKARTIKRQSIVTMVTKRQISTKAK
ncbi:hypothetical protein GCM10027321_09110 [Massilia terrae]|uniref:Uncharacterized protein n=1 Tax=Massilia terrae TaxID=1811224 RepID=A0ABT2CZX5_9BURK|nr:hypothetical protein [Massilia terrae]MCS0659517.1 hypothetical protein [Massilia terrae]